MPEEVKKVLADRRTVVQTLGGIGVLTATAGRVAGADEEGNAPRESPAAYQRELRAEIMQSITRNIREAKRADKNGGE